MRKHCTYDRPLFVCTTWYKRVTTQADAVGTHEILLADVRNSALERRFRAQSQVSDTVCAKIQHYSGIKKTSIVSAILCPVRDSFYRP